MGRGKTPARTAAIPPPRAVEITPDAIRIRKKVLECNRRPRRDGPKKKDK